MSLEPLRYEFWQPPLYYLLAAPVYRLFDGALIPLRLLSLLLGAGVVVMAYAVALAMRPGDAGLALGASAFVAFVPMHLTVMASVNNDSLAELLLTGVMLLLIRWTRRPAGQGGRLAYLAVTGLLLGLGLVTKATVYLAIPLALVALALAERRPAALARQGLALFAPALALAIPWYLRNVTVYGWPDLLGMRRHDAVVVGQLRTADYLASAGWATYLKDLLVTSFHSFWGQFGWMAVPMDGRIYLALGLLSALMAVGVLSWKVGRLARPGCLARRLGRAATRAGEDWKIGGLVALWLLFTVLIYLYYNLWLVQFQGRYLFPALIPIGWLGTLGLREILSRRRAWLGAAVCAAVGVVIGLASLVAGDLDTPGVLLAGGAALALVARRWLPARLDGWLPAIPLAGLAGLAVYSLFVFIVPYLRA
jgi:4-amino-4-deoxy-L-arabinose transferase-like glycosyltransferase